MVFRAEGAIVVVISGDRRVDLSKLAESAGQRISVATPEEVRSLTGYPIGGVPPFPHVQSVRVLFDQSLQRFDWVWAAGGAPNVVFRVRTEDLLRALGGAPVDVAARA